MIIKMITEWKYIQNKKVSEKLFFYFLFATYDYPTANFDPLMRR